MPKKSAAVIYLASQSPRRREILKEMRVPFRVVPSVYEEKIVSNMSPDQLAMWHAASKARYAQAPKQARFVLGADTIVVMDEHILGKPESMEHARRMLGLLSGKAHFVLTAISIFDHKTHSILTGCAVTKVFFKKLSGKDISNYLAKVNPLDKAGAYAIQEGPKIVKKIEGSYSNVVGLPKELLRELLKDLEK